MLNANARWNHQRWGSPTDLIHQSDIASLVGKYSCPESFRRRKIEHATGVRVERDRISGKLALGRAVHEAIRALLTDGEPVTVPSRARVALELNHQIDRAREGLDIDWYDLDRDDALRDAEHMVANLLVDLSTRVESVVASEASFALPLSGAWFAGTVDLIYRPRSNPTEYALCDWKTGAQKPAQIELDHAWQYAIYAAAMRLGRFVARKQIEEAARHLGVGARAASDHLCREIASAHPAPPAELEWFDLATSPAEIHHVHLRDYVPYSRAGSRRIERHEDLVWAGLTAPAQRPYKAGDQRGPAWYRVRRREADNTRLEHVVRAIVGWVRFGRFPSAPGEICSRCPYRDPCLLDGYAPRGEDAKELNSALRTLGVGASDDGLVDAF